MAPIESTAAPMKKNSALFFFFFAFLFNFYTIAMADSRPFWITNRPVDPNFYVGIGMSEKEGNKEIYRERAKNAAFIDLASEISVSISVSFVQKIIERTGLTEQEVRSEINTFTRAHLREYQFVDEWETRKEYWIYYRLSKERHKVLLDLNKQKAVKAARAMIIKAAAEKKRRNIISSLRFYFEALAEIQDFTGEPLISEIHGKPIFLFNEIYSGMQLILSEISLYPDRKSVPALIEQPLREPLTVIATFKNTTGNRILIPNLPIRFSLPRRDWIPTDVIQTDNQGTARFTLACVTASDHGQPVRAKLDIARFFPQNDSSVFFKELVKKLTVPETSLFLKIFSDKEEYFWHWEFEGKNILVFSAYEINKKVVTWPKMHDEVMIFLQRMGANVKVEKRNVNLSNVMHWSSNHNSKCGTDSEENADFVFVLVAIGKLNKRSNSKNPLGEDVQFAGELRTAVYKGKEPYFFDRYSGTSGWNPMGEQMCMDVTAIHVLKRFKSKYLYHMGLANEQKDL